MKKIGLTGGIGGGKSTVAEVFSRLGVPVFISDRVAKELQEHDEKVRDEIMKIFGREIYQHDKLDRAKLAEIVFADKIKLDRLNQVVHPAVGRAFEKFCERNSSAKYILKESAILFEIGDDKNLDAMIVVTAPDELRIRRVMLRDGLEREAVLGRIKNQLSQDEKAKKAGFCIINDEEQLILPQVLSVNEKIISR
ncbi:MAG: dephospho-CoA kinase [Bacteroidota bacterium]|nr:dephospho-CoA kinase [Bacteroidota bacterium]